MTTCTSKIDQTATELSKLLGYNEEQEWALRRDLVKMRDQLSAKMAPYKNMWEPLKVNDIVRIEYGNGEFRLYRVEGILHDEYFLEPVV